MSKRGSGATVERAMMEEKNNPNMAPATSGRRSVKGKYDSNSYPIWKEKWRESCCKRVRQDRSQLIWKMRLSGAKSLDKQDQDSIKSALRGIVSDELKRIRQDDDDNDGGNKKLLIAQSAVDNDDDMLWEYDGLHDAYDGDCEEILLEMQRIFYEDLKEESNMKESEPSADEWEDREDEYLARAVYEHMQLSNEVGKKVWCPVCMQGELLEKSKVIHCTLCSLELNKCDEVTLDRIDCRLADVHAEHFARGCRQKPKFRIRTRFGLTALYMSCQDCNVFDLVI
ncbi:hypothetical protein LINGRAHAP2_LOCUS19148 [Linum grandiflorum]